MNEKMEANIILTTLQNLVAKIDEFQKDLSGNRERIIIIETGELNQKEERKKFQEVTWPSMESEVKELRLRLDKIEKEAISLKKIEDIDTKLTTVLTRLEIWIPRMEKIEEKLPKIDEMGWKMKLVWASSSAAISLITAIITGLMLKALL